MRPLKFLLAGCFCEWSSLLHSCNGCGAVECFYMERLEYFRFYYLDLCWMQCSLLHGVGKEEDVQREHRAPNGLETMGLNVFYLIRQECPLGCVGFNLVFQCLELYWWFCTKSFLTRDVPLGLPELRLEETHNRVSGTEMVLCSLMINWWVA